MADPYCRPLALVIALGNSTRRNRIDTRSQWDHVFVHQLAYLAGPRHWRSVLRDISLLLRIPGIASYESLRAEREKRRPTCPGVHAHHRVQTQQTSLIARWPPSTLSPPPAATGRNALLDPDRMRETRDERSCCSSRKTPKGFPHVLAPARRARPAAGLSASREWHFPNRPRRLC